jgi:3-oxoacyl-[acyl-carrier-protein] synthase-3
MSDPTPAPRFQNPRARHHFTSRTCSVTGVGSYVPERVLTNADLEQMVDTSDEWITTRTGIRERRLAADQETTSDMAAEASRRALEMAGVSAEEVDLIIVATVTPDMPFPATACLVQEKIGARNAAAFDVEAACSGFVFALEIGHQFVASRTHEVVLVIGAEKLSALVDWQDRNTCVLFGDGAGAAVLRHRPDSAGLLTVTMGADGGKGSLLCVPAGGAARPASVESVRQRLHFIRMDGRETFKNAVQAMLSAAREALARCELDISQIQCVIPHQANQRIIDAVGSRLGVKEEQLFVNLDKYGNTSAASVVIALDEAVRGGRIKRGDLVLMTVFGGGFTWGGAVLEW